MGSRRLLIVTADDFGLTPGVCEAVLVAHERGIVTSTSALVVAPAFDRYAAALEGSGLGVGAHLCAVGEDPPLLSAREIPTLVDDRGRFPADWKRFVARAATGRIDRDDLRREFTAQLETLASAGIVPTHVDSHQHLHQVPVVASVVLGLACERGIGAVRSTRTDRWSPSSIGVRALGGRFRQRAERAGLVTTDGSSGLDGAGHLTLGAIISTLAAVGSTGVGSYELAAHPGLADDPDRSRYEWGYDWAGEFEALCHPSARRAVDDNGFRLGTFAELVGGPDAAA